MRHVCAIFAVLASTLGLASTYDFGTFQITTNEELWLGAKYAGYPVHYLFDGNPRTPWVYKGLKDSEAFRNEWGSREEFGERLYDLRIGFEEKRVSEIRIIPGYSKDQDAWNRNNRIKRLRVWSGWNKEKLLADVRLPDQMRWHSVKFKPVYTSAVLLEPVEFYRGPDDDVCISEVELRDHGRVIRFDTDRMALLNVGGGCCCTQRFAAVNRHGTRLMEFDTGEGFPNAEISEDGRYLAGTQVSKSGRIDVFVFDSSKALVAAKKTLRNVDPAELYLSWEGRRLFDGPPGDRRRKVLLDLDRASR